MDNIELIAKLQNIADNYKTVYMWGVFGSPVSETVITSKSKQYPNWYTSSKQTLFRSLIPKGYFAFDCVNLIKAILWGWNGDKTKSYGGATYNTNGVPDISANGMLGKLINPTTNFSKIEKGEVVWMDGHIGVYIGNGKVIECTPKWNNSVQVTACLNIGSISGLNGRTWTKHGKLPYIGYVEVVIPVVKPIENIIIEDEEEMVIRYNSLADIPTWGKPTIEKLIAKGVLSGDGTGLNISEDMLRVFVINFRLGLYK